MQLDRGREARHYTPTAGMREGHNVIPCSNPYRPRTDLAGNGRALKYIGIGMRIKKQIMAAGPAYSRAAPHLRQPLYVE